MANTNVKEDKRRIKIIGFGKPKPIAGHPDFGKAVNVDRVNDFNVNKLEALNNLLDGKATKKDYDILKGSK
jgi:hypothetical protein